MQDYRPIRVLQAFVANDKGGLTGYICQNYRFIDRSKVQFDFLTFEEDKLDFEDEFQEMGARFYHIPRPSNPVAYAKSLRNILRKTKYTAVHFNMSYANFVPVIIARWLGAEKIIMHSHSTAIDDRRNGVRFVKTIIHKLGRMLMPYMADEYLACSLLAGSWMYPQNILCSGNYHLAKNAIDLKEYSYNPQIRGIYRKELSISENAYVIGHIGRFTYQKNHEFLIDVFKDVHAKRPDSKLLLIGEGPEENIIRNKVKTSGLAGSVLFLGRRNDVNKLFQVMDCFVLPSRFEGLPIVGIEAQTAGLQCVFSDTITREIDINGESAFLSLNREKEWVNTIIDLHDNPNRFPSLSPIRNAGYDIHNAVTRMESLYLTDAKS